VCDCCFERFVVIVLGSSKRDFISFSGDLAIIADLPQEVVSYWDLQVGQDQFAC